MMRRLPLRQEAGDSVEPQREQPVTILTLNFSEFSMGSDVLISCDVAQRLVSRCFGRVGRKTWIGSYSERSSQKGKREMIRKGRGPRTQACGPPFEHIH